MHTDLHGQLTAVQSSYIVYMHVAGRGQNVLVTITITSTCYVLFMKKHTS